MQKDITGEAYWPIERSGYNNWTWFISQIDQLKIPPRITCTGPWIPEEISDINSNIFHVYYPTFLSTPYHIRNDILTKIPRSQDPHLEIVNFLHDPS